MKQNIYQQSPEGATEKNVWHWFDDTTHPGIRFCSPLRYRNKATGCVALSSKSITICSIAPSRLVDGSVSMQGFRCAPPLPVVFRPFRVLFRPFYVRFLHKPIIINRLHQNHTDFDTVSQPSHFQSFKGPTPSYVQYMYNTCTIFVRLQLYKYCTSIVHILYNDRSWSLNGLEMWHC